MANRIVVTYVNGDVKTYDNIVEHLQIYRSSIEFYLNSKSSRELKIIPFSHVLDITVEGE